MSKTKDVGLDKDERVLSQIAYALRAGGERKNLSCNNI